MKKENQIIQNEKKKVPWNKGLTKETDERVRKYSTPRSKETIEKMKDNHKGMSGLKASEAWKEQKRDFMVKWHEENKGTVDYQKRCENISKAKIGHEVSKKTRKKISRNRFGKTAREKNPNWQGGISFEPYDKSFNNIFKRSIRKRDNQICMLCGIHREKLNEALIVHHINYDKKMSLPQNCISLCRKCHVGLVHANKNKLSHWKIFFQSLLAEKYDYQYSENKEIMLNLNKLN